MTVAVIAEMLARSKKNILREMSCTAPYQAYRERVRE